MFRVQAARIAQGKSNSNMRNMVFIVMGNKQYNAYFNLPTAGDGSISLRHGDFGIRKQQTIRDFRII